MELADVIKLHVKGNLASAKSGYLNLLAREGNPIAAQNLMAICRSDNDYKLSDKLFTEATSGGWSNCSLYLNYGNICMDRELFHDATQSFREGLLLKGNERDTEKDELIVGLCNSLRQTDNYELCMSVGIELSKDCSGNRGAELLLGLAEYYMQRAESGDESLNDVSHAAKLLLEDSLNELEDGFKSRMHMSLAIAVGNKIGLTQGLDMFMRAYKTANSIALNSTGEKRRLLLKSIDLNAWNMSLFLLKKGLFREGWSLYDHGMNVKASGPQRWQRALIKVFNIGTIPAWNIHHSKKTDRVLVMGEQGIGDTMMFAQLLPKIASDCAKVYFCPGHRLENLYNKTIDNVQIVGVEDLKKLQPYIDSQIPIGSLPKYYFAERKEDHVAYAGYLKPNDALRKELEEKYRTMGLLDKPLIGISWQGGGKKGRIERKSAPLRKMVELLLSNQYNLVSLQYGDDNPNIQALNNTYNRQVVYDDPDIDAFRNMDTWMAQVSLMTAVVSIANTTIHGAGCLGIKTLCLVTKDADWRWLDGKEEWDSLWYDSVDAVYQLDNEDTLERQLKYAKTWAESVVSDIP